jgi:hypothetical protein
MILRTLFSLGLLIAGRQTAPATLVLSQLGEGPALSYEGNVPFFEVSTQGRATETKRLGGTVNRLGMDYPAKARDTDFVSFTLPAGSYEVLSYVRACDGNCNHLDAPQIECRVSVTLKAGETLYAVRQQSKQPICTLSVSSDKPKSLN